MIKTEKVCKETTWKSRLFPIKVTHSIVFGLPDVSTLLSSLKRRKKIQSAIHNIRQNILRDRSSQEKQLKIEATKSILQCVTTAPAHQFEPEYFAKMVKKITVDNEKVVFTLCNGLELSESREEIK